MLTCRALIAMLVVAGESYHKLLCLGTGFVLGFLLEVRRIFAPKCGGQATVMKDLDFSALPYPVGEAEIVWFRRSLHFEVLRAVKGVFCAA